MAYTDEEDGMGFSGLVPSREEVKRNRAVAARNSFEERSNELHANAKLIAAAPELLEAIQAALRIEPLWMPPDDENNPEYDAEFAALAMMRNQFKAVVAKVV